MNSSTPRRSLETNSVERPTFLGWSASSPGAPFWEEIGVGSTRALKMEPAPILAGLSTPTDLVSRQAFRRPLRRYPGAPGHEFQNPRPSTFDDDKGTASPRSHVSPLFESPHVDE